MPSIPDPRMNPEGERAFGTVINDKEGHHYVYIKKETDDITTSSRFFTAGTQVDVDKITPAFLIVPDLSDEELNEYQYLDFDEKTNLLEKLENIANKLNECLSECSNIPVKVNLVHGFDKKPVIFDLIDVIGISSNVDQKVIKKLNKEAEKILKG
jgi:hypothetical protein